jgi:hypothetical protein
VIGHLYRRLFTGFRWSTGGQPHARWAPTMRARQRWQIDASEVSKVRVAGALPLFPMSGGPAIPSSVVHIRAFTRQSELDFTLPKLRLKDRSRRSLIAISRTAKHRRRARFRFLHSSEMTRCASARSDFVEVRQIAPWIPARFCLTLGYCRTSRNFSSFFIRLVRAERESPGEDRPMLYSR